MKRVRQTDVLFPSPEPQASVPRDMTAAIWIGPDGRHTGVRIVIDPQHLLLAVERVRVRQRFASFSLIERSRPRSSVSFQTQGEPACGMPFQRRRLKGFCCRELHGAPLKGYRNVRLRRLTNSHTDIWQICSETSKPQAVAREQKMVPLTGPCGSSTPLFDGDARAYRLAVHAYADERFAALARKTVHALKQFRATGIFDEQEYNSVWDEYCHEVQHGPHEELEGAWDTLVDPIITHIIGTLPRTEIVLLTLAASDGLDDHQEALLRSGAIFPENIRQVVVRLLREIAVNRPLERIRWRSRSASGRTRQLPKSDEAQARHS